LKFVVTGASGFVGRQLLPRLSRSGHKTIACGRTVPETAGPAGETNAAPYLDFPQVAIGADRVLHLAAVNTTSTAGDDTFFKVNAGLTQELAEKAAAAGIPLFINFSSFHALADGPQTAYARSKREGIKRLAKVTGIRKINLFLPAVYGDAFAGKLAILNKVPKVLRPAAFTVLSALGPAVHINRIADAVSGPLEDREEDDPLFLADPQDENVIYRLGRKLIDIGFAVAVLAVFWWLLLAVWVLVKTGSEGPGIFAQERIGKGGAVFTCYKFRTMGKDTRQAGTHEISESAVTPIGAFLRKTKIDELPQVWNILKGELSLIGPRPCLPVQVELVAERRKRGVLGVLPGITGLAQIQGIDMSHPVRLARKDAEYIARCGLLLDLKIILATFTGKGQGDRTAK